MASGMHGHGAMGRALWKGLLAFGLVNIPVELHKAIREDRPRFRMLHATDKSPVRLDRVCQKDGHSVAWQDLVKGYEYEKGRFVVVTKDDFQAAALEKTRTIDILEFVEAKDIDDRFFETPYYLLPAAKSGERAYAVLRETLRTSGRIGIAKFILREAQHLAAVEAIGNALVLSVMRFATELVDADRFGFPADVKPRKEELQMARTLVEHLAADWDPARYTDDYTANLMRVIKGKLKGRKNVAPEPTGERQPADVVNLMERLRQSLAEKTGAAGAKRSPGRRKRRAA
jgi:DNA end-binding protein Ku